MRNERASKRSRSRRARRVFRGMGAVGVVLLLGLGFAEVATAAPSGASMPWDAPLTNILDNLQGTVARVLVTVAVVLTGLLFAFGEAGGAFRRIFGIAFGGALALGALTFMAALGFVGATFLV